MTRTDDGKERLDFDKWFESTHSGEWTPTLLAMRECCWLGWEAARAHQQDYLPVWVACSERLPEVIMDKDGRVNCVLSYAKDGYECGSDFQVVNAAWMNGPYRTTLTTHWMPLPPTPETNTTGE